MKPLEYFQHLNKYRQKNKQMSLTSIFKMQSNLNKQWLQASYELSFLLAKESRPHTDDEKLLKPAFAVYYRTMLDSRTNGHQLASLSLSNDTVRRRIDEMAIDVKLQLNNFLRNTKFSLVLDESIFRDSEALLLGYTRFKQDSKSVEEMLFCESLKTTTTSRDIYAVVKQCFAENSITISNLISVAADGASVMKGRHNGILKLLKNDNPNIMAAHCIIYRENLAAATFSCELDQLLKKVISVVNWIKSCPTNERLFKQLCVDMEESQIRLLLHTRVQWL